MGSRLRGWWVVVAAGSIALLLADAGAGVRWTPPATWKAAAQRPMRLATYAVPHVAGDAEDGECGVYYFGQGQGGSVDANLDRWIGQMLQADGKASKQAAKIAHSMVHGMRLTTVDVSGSYTGMGGPMANAPSNPKTGYRLLGAIIEGPQGSVFFKFTGPAKTVAQNQPPFQTMLASLNPQ